MKMNVGVARTSNCVTNSWRIILRCYLTSYIFYAQSKKNEDRNQLQIFSMHKVKKMKTEIIGWNFEY